MPWFIKSEIAWLREHGKKDLKGAWTCRKTGKPINTADVGRSIHTGIFPGAGAGEVRTVTHLNCNACSPRKKPPRYGEPIEESLLIQID